MESFSSYKEKRSYPRFAIAIPSSFFDGNLNNTTQTHDISVEGLCLLVDKKITNGTCVDVFIQMPDNGEKIYRKGIVIWSGKVNSEKYRIGIRLEAEKLKPIPLVLRAIMSRKK